MGGAPGPPGGRVSPEADAFKEFDQEFYASSENLTELVQKYAFD
jgi:hypothetical protein